MYTFYTTADTAIPWDISIQVVHIPGTATPYYF